jgi:hypothetical protein
MDLSAMVRKQLVEKPDRTGIFVTESLQVARDATMPGVQLDTGLARVNLWPGALDFAAPGRFLSQSVGFLGELVGDLFGGNVTVIRVKTNFLSVEVGNQPVFLLRADRSDRAKVDMALLLVDPMARPATTVLATLFNLSEKVNSYPALFLAGQSSRSVDQVAFLWSSVPVARRSEIGAECALAQQGRPRRAGRVRGSFGRQLIAKEQPKKEQIFDPYKYQSWAYGWIIKR